MRMRHIVIYGLPGFITFFPPYLITGTILENVYWPKKVCFDFSTTFVRNILFQEEMRDIWSETRIGLHVNYPLLFSDFNEIDIFSNNTQIAWKSLQ
jgi:hypothetical protein